ncbi:MAG: hypothetical protein ACRDN0_06100 [Trebonia sp.]
MSLADVGAIDEAARAALTPGDPAASVAVARASPGAQLAEAIGRLTRHRSPRTALSWSVRTLTCRPPVTR